MIDEPLVLTIPDVPPSMNVIGGHSNWTKYRWQKNKWENIVLIELAMSKLGKPLRIPVWVTAQLRFPTNRRRDEGNYRMMLEKVCGDALVGGDWIPDDTPEYYRFGEVTFSDERGASQTILTFTQGNTRPEFIPEGSY